MTTQGDQILDRPLAAIGGKGLFVKELEVAMAEGRADLAVHSLKDVPMELPEGFVLAAIAAREDPRDAFVSNRYASLRELPAGAIVGTSSLRREAQLRERFPQLEIQPLRGNVNTRLRKLDEGQYDAIILAVAGLKRLGFGDRIRDLIDPADSLPAPGQGALGLECRADRADVIGCAGAARRPADHARHRRPSARSRARSPAAAARRSPPTASWQEDALWLRGLVASHDGREVMRAERRRAVADVGAAETLGLALADELLVARRRAVHRRRLSRA